MLHRISAACLLLLALSAPTAGAATARTAPLPAGTWEGRAGHGLVVAQTDQRGRITAIIGESQGEPCNGVSLRAPIPVVKGRGDERHKRGAWTQAVKVRVLDRARLTLTTNVRLAAGAQPCTRTRSLTLSRVAAPITPTPGTWSGTDALGGQVVLVLRKPDRPGAASPVSYLRSRTVKGPFWCGIGGRTDVPAPPGGWTVMGFVQPIPVLLPIAPSNGAMKSVITQASPPQDGPLTTRVHEITGTFTATTASGTWRLSQTDAAGTVICDSGPVAWTASR